jgi:glycerophosphoryl diester phosphodiesterase
MRADATAPFRLYGHRGAPVERPESTLESFHRAVELGVDALEMDVHRTADGHIVVSHDPSGERMAGERKLIRSSTLAEVKTWNAGRGFVDRAGARPYADAGCRIPTLEEVLEAFPKTILNVDIKQTEPDVVSDLLALLRRQRAEQRVVLASFRARTIRAVRRAGFRGETVLARREVIGLLAVPSTLRRFRPIQGTAVQVPERAGPIDFSAPWFIARCHALGLRVDFWTVNDPAQAERLLERGADGLMTDDPAAIAPVVRRWQQDVED